MAALGFCVSGLLGSCTGTGSENQLSAYVADHWPHWAGGMPADVPPRPGTPGYAEFIAHGQAEQQVGQQAAPQAVPAIASAPASGVPAKPVMQTALPPPGAPAVQAAPPPPSAPQAAADSGLVRGGLY